MAADQDIAAVLEAARAERRARLREEAIDAAAYQAELEAQGYTRTEALELVQHWQGYRWEEGAP